MLNFFKKLPVCYKTFFIVGLIAIIYTVYKNIGVLSHYVNLILAKFGYKQESFDNEVHTIQPNEQKSLVLFYAPWCPHCKSMLPEWAKLKSNNKTDIAIKKVNSDDNPELCKQYKIEGFPTVLLIDSNGQVIAIYEGARTAESLAEFIKNK